MMKKQALIIGAGPAGLTAAFELLSQSSDYNVLIVEATNRVGGISCTINHNGNRIDIGGHRFFSKSDTVMNWWKERMPVQGSPAIDDIVLERDKAMFPGGPNPEVEDRVMLIRDRLSRIFFKKKFFDYPISLSAKTIANLGLLTTAKAGLGFVWSQIMRIKDESNLEAFLINRFGRPLYQMFFESYTEKVWGAHPTRISAEWGAQRIKGLSLFGLVYQALKKLIPSTVSSDVDQKKTETSLIERFFYPKLGPGQMWESVLEDVIGMGGKVEFDSKVVGIQVAEGGTKIQKVTVEGADGLFSVNPDVVFSTMPIKDLVEGIEDSRMDSSILTIATGLPYRDFMTVGVLVDRLAVKNESKVKTLNDVIPDTWLYIQEPEVKLCRLQIFNNWSPYMVADPRKVWIGLEYMCDESDAEWDMSDSEFIAFAIDELDSIGIINREDVLDSCRIKIEKAYPAYFGTYDQFEKVRAYLNQLENLYCLGRNGQHRYNNQDHSMLTSIAAVKQVISGKVDRSELWSINAEKEYHEEK